MRREITAMTERERTAYLLRQQGMLYREIAEKMGCSISTANALCRKAESAIRWAAYERETRGTDSRPVAVTLTRREWKLVRDGLYQLHLRQKKSAPKGRAGEGAGELSESGQAVVKLLRKVDDVLDKRTAAGLEQRK